MVKNLFKPTDSNNLRIHSKYFTVLFSLILHIQLALALFRRSEQNTYILVTKSSFACMIWGAMSNGVLCDGVFVIIFFQAMYNKTMIRFGFCDIQNNQGLGKGYQPRPSARVITLTLNLSRYHKNFIQ